jgi:anti-sigma factor RsiW
MTEHLREDRINDYVDDLLCREERAEAEQHLLVCDVCQAEVAALRNLAAGLGGVAQEISPSRDLLSGINERIDAAASDATDAVRAAPLTARPSQRSMRSLAPYRYQLAAAAVVLVAVSVAITSALVRRGSDSAPVGVSSGDARSTATQPVPMAVPVSRVDDRYGNAARELEQQLAQQRSKLAPETVRLVEENLRVIDEALAEARAALRDDPNNAALNDLMRSAYEKKLDLLRHATQTRGTT